MTLMDTEDDKKQEAEWRECPLRGMNMQSIAFDPTNRLLAACSNRECILFDVEKGKRVCFVEHSSSLVGCFFKTDTQLTTVDSAGEVHKWEVSETSAILIDSYQLSSPAAHVFPGESIGEGFAIVDKLTTRSKRKSACTQSLSLVKDDGQLELICALPLNASPDTVAVSDTFVAVCQGKTVRVSPRTKDVKESEYKLKVRIESLGDANTLNVFERVSVRADTVAAAITVGRVFIWSEVPRYGIGRDPRSVHWHSSAPQVALSPFGGFFSAGGECVLAKWKMGVSEPSLLPRLPSLVKKMTLSQDATYAALLLEDNSLVVVHTGSMSVQCRAATVTRFSGRDDVTSPVIMAQDPAQFGFVVMTGRAGWLQWVDPIASSSSLMVDISQENPLHADLPIYGVKQNFALITGVCFSKEHGLTVERQARESEGVPESILKIWQRSKNLNGLQLLFTLRMHTDIVFVTSRITTATHPLFVAIDGKGVGYCIEKLSGGLWHADPNKFFSWKSCTVRAISRINDAMLLAVAYQAADEVDVVVVWDLETMRLVDVLRVQGVVRSIGYTSEGGEYLLVAATSEALYAWQARSLTLRWRIDQGCSAHFGNRLVVWSNKNVMMISPASGKVQMRYGISENEEAEESATQLAISFSFSAKYGILRMDRTGMLSVLTLGGLPAAVGRLPRARTTSTSSQQSQRSSHSSERKAKTRSGGPIQPQPVAVKPDVKPLEPPAHMLPPLPHLAASFIRSCLLRPQ